MMNQANHSEWLRSGVHLRPVGAGGHLDRAVHRLRDQDPGLPVPHLAARRARRGADRDLRHPRRRAAEDGHLRHPAHQLRHPARRRRRSWPSGSSACVGAVNIVYGALCAMAQKDLKKLVAYSSVSHMGYVMLGMASLHAGGDQRRGAADVQPRHRHGDALPPRRRHLRPRPPPQHRRLRRARLRDAGLHRRHRDRLLRGARPARAVGLHLRGAGPARRLAALSRC